MVATALVAPTGHIQPPIPITVLPKIVTLFQANNFELLEDLLNQKQEVVRNTTPPGGSV
jgi:hypothetical protein